MEIIKTIKVLNKTEADGVIDRYAIGGAVGATFYIEPAETQDVDVFVHFRTTSELKLISLAPLYEYLKKRGHKVEGEYIVIHGWPVQFLPPDSPLVEEAIRDAVEVSVEGVHTRVFTAEHLTAIALKLGRMKDKFRIAQFLGSDCLDMERLTPILERHTLLDAWRTCCERLPEL